MKKQQAFTIIEMLAIIVIMGIMLVLVLPNLIGVSDKNKQNKYDQLIDNVKLAAETYINANYENPTYPLQVELQTIIDANYLDGPLINPLTNEELDYEAFVLATQNADNSITYTYPIEEAAGGSTVVFGPNGNSSYTPSVSTTATVVDSDGVDTTSLKYMWNTSVSKPLEVSFTTSFTNGGSITSPSGVSGIYYLWILAKDTLGNVTITKSNAFKIDNSVPIVSFGMNGNTTYAKSRSTVVSIYDNGTMNTSSFKYLWTTTTTTPTEASFSTSFTNNTAITTPSGVTGGYYLWVLVKDTAGNTIITRSNIFNLDNTIPVITMNGSTPVTMKLYNTYTDASATATDAISGTVSVTTTSTVVTTLSGTYTVTYNATDSSGNAAIPVVRTVNVANICLYVNSGTYNYRMVYNGSTWTTENIADARSMTVVAVGDANTIYVNSGTYNYRMVYNGSTWTTANIADARSMTMIAAGDANTIFVYYNTYNYRFVYNGSTWTTANIADARSMTITATADANTIFVYYNTYNYRLTYNGSTWITENIADARSMTITAAYDANTFFAYYNTYNYMFRYSNGVWTLTNIVDARSMTIKGVGK